VKFKGNQYIKQKHDMDVIQFLKQHDLCQPFEIPDSWQEWAHLHSCAHSSAIPTWTLPSTNLKRYY
jgi:hypothetical protein